MLKKIAVSIFNLLPSSLKNDIILWHGSRNKEKTIQDWIDSGRPVPPPHYIKQSIITGHQKESGYKVLVETGTFWGDMVNAQRKNFAKIYSIELGVDLWKSAVKRFESYDHIEIIQGDSGKVLRNVTQKLNEPAIFWLDGHYSAGLTARGDKDCPIYEEIDAIFAGNKHDHIIIIDDNRLFVGEGDYPKREDLTKYIQSKDPRYVLKINDDAMQFVIEKKK